MGQENRYSARRRKTCLSKAAVILLLLAVAVVTLFPFYWMFVTAVKPIDEVLAYPPRLVPSEIIWGNFAKSMKAANFPKYFMNSFIVTAVSTAITVFINLLAGYSFAKYKFRYKEVMFLIVLSTLMIPLQVTMIPTFIIASRIGIRNSLIGLALPPCAEAFGLFMARQFISEIPDELLEAGRIDGATEFTIFSKIVVPNVRPLISVLVIFTVMWRWNDLQWPLIMISKEPLYTVQLGLSMLNGAQYVNWNDIMSASLISVIPVMVVFFIFQKQFVQGMAASGIKG